MYLNWKIIGNVVAKGRYNRIVIGATPLAIDVGESIDKNWRASTLRVFSKDVFTGQLALSVCAIGKTTFKGCLYRRRKHDRTLVVLLFKDSE